MKRPTAASLKKVTPENLASLGAERLAQILAAVAQTRPDLKRRLRMELAAEQGADHLVVEVDRRLASLQASRSRISWRNRATFLRDLDNLRILIAERLAGLDGLSALDQMWRFMDLARPLATRVRDRDGQLDAVFQRAATDLARLLAERRPAGTAGRWAEELSKNPVAWAVWLPAILPSTPRDLVASTLGFISQESGASPGRLALVRQFADAAGDMDAFLATFSATALKTPSIAAEVAGRLLAADRMEDAGRILLDAAPGGQGVREPDFDWESAWIDYLDRSGKAAAAQEVRWASFERTLSAERARAFTRRLADFEDVEAEARAFEHAAAHPDFGRALRFLMEWPALPAAAQMIESRGEEAGIAAEQAESWAAKLRPRQPAAAHALLRKAAAAAFRRRDFATCNRLTEEADAIDLAPSAKPERRPR